MIRGVVFGSIGLLISGCASVGLNSDSVGVVTETYGQCLVNTENGPKFNKKRVTFYCQDEWVLLGKPFEKEGAYYFESAKLVKNKKGQYIEDKKRVRLIKGLHSVCQLQPIQGQGDQTIRRYYFDMSLKTCRPFIWHGSGGFVPFKNADECTAYCEL